MEENEVITTEEAARRANKTTAAIRKAAKRGNLKAVKHGRDWLITAKSLEAWLSDPSLHRPGPNPKKR